MKFRSLSFLAFVVFISCKTSTVVINKKSIRTIEPENLIDSLNENKGDFATINAKFKVLLKVNKKTNALAGTIRATPDSAIWFSLNPGLGIEVARGALTPDSLVFVERIKSSFYRGNYQNINELLNVDVDFKLLQSIFFNSMYFYNSKDKSDLIKNAIVHKDINGKEIEIINVARRKAKRKDDQDDGGKIFQKVKIDNTILKISEIIIKDFKENKSIHVEYSDFIYIDTIKTDFPHSFKISISSKKEHLTIDFKYSKLSFNSANDYSVSIPSSYQPIFKE